MKSDEWISMKAAAAMLALKPQTLYAYVSRGLLRAKRDPESVNRSLYARRDVMALAAQKQKPRARAKIASGTIRWGEPVLETAISCIRDGELYFGDQRARDLAETFTVEQIAAHHWRVPVVAPRKRKVTAVNKSSSVVGRGLSFLAAEAATAIPIFGRTRSALASEGFTLLSRFTESLAGPAPGNAIHERLQRAWKCDAFTGDLVRRALVLISDHELNASTFAVRVAASTGASIPAAVLAGLATLSGPLHGGATMGALRSIREAMRCADIASFLAKGSAMMPNRPGFGHPLYPDGDPRAAALLDATPIGKSLRAAIEGFSEITGQEPNVDAALAALAISRDLPDVAPFTIFAVGRLTGWIAHAIEQIEGGQLIRPRARFRDSW